MKLIEADFDLNKAVLNGIRHLNKESAKRFRKCSYALWFDLDIALQMVKPQFDEFFMKQATEMLKEAWNMVQEIKKEERPLAGGRSVSKTPHKG